MNNETNVIFQPIFSSGLLTVQLSNVLKNDNNETDDRCWFLIYMRGRIVDDQPMIPDEIRFNQSLCFSCSKFELSTIITEEMTTPFSSTRLDTSMITSLSTIITTITTTTMVIRQLDQRTGLFNLILQMRKGTDRIDQFILHFICNRSENDLDWPIDHRSCLVI